MLLLKHTFSAAMVNSVNFASGLNRLRVITRALVNFTMSVIGAVHVAWVLLIVFDLTGLFALV